MPEKKQHHISKEDLLKGIDFEIKNAKDINEAAEVALDNLLQSPDYYNIVSPTDELVDMNREDILQDTQPDDANLWALEPEKVSEDIVNQVSPAQLRKSVSFIESVSDYTMFSKNELHKHYTIIKRNIKKAISYSHDEPIFYEKLMGLRTYLNSLGLNEDGTSLYMASDGVVENEMPSGAFNVEDLKKIRSYKGRIYYLKTKLQLLGQGSSRMVFKIDGQKVIKLAKNKKGIGQNFLEAEVGQDNFFVEVVAKVYEYDPDFVWLISEYADKFSDAEFKKIEGYDFRTLGVYLTSEKYGHKWEQGVSPEEYDAFIYSPSPNTLATNVEQLMRDYNMPVGDLVVKSSYGISTRNGDRAVILIDYGYDENVYKTYYSKIKEYVIREMEMYSKDQQPVNERKISYMPDSSTVEVKQNCRLAGNADGTSDACNQGEIKNLNLKKITEGTADLAYKKWKRDNVTYRGVSEDAVNGENGGMAMLGQGLYSVPASNKSMARKYGKLVMLVNAKPKNPKVFNTLNDWEIWFQNNVVLPISKAKGKTYPDGRDVNSISEEMMKLGYDGVIIKGREIVNYKPENVRYYYNERQLEMHYDDYVAPNSNLTEKVNINLPSGELDGYKSLDITNDGEVIGQMELVNRDNGYIVLDKILINKEHRGKGYADEAMKILLNYADKTGKIITLTPDSTWGSNKERLKKWYKSHGFVLNKGRNKDFKTMQLMYKTPSTINEADYDENKMRKSVLTNFLNKLEEYQSNHYGNIDRNDIVQAWSMLHPKVKEYIKPTPQQLQNLYRGADGISPKKAISFTNNKTVAAFFGTYVLPFKELQSFGGLISTDKVVKLIDGFKLNFDIGDDEGEVIVLNPIWKKFNIEKYRATQLAEDLSYSHVTDATQDSYKMGLEEGESFDVYKKDNDPSNDRYFKYKDSLGGEAYGQLKGNVGRIISMNSVPFGMRYSPNAGDFKKRGFFTNLINKLKENGVVSITIRLQSEETRKAVKRLLEKGVLSNPRNYYGLSDDEYPTLFDIGKINEEKINDNSNEMVFWHGGNLDDYSEVIAHRNGRYEYGAGLYMTTSYEVVKKYARGSRKLYQITVEKGVDINDAFLDLEKALNFINTYVLTAKRKSIIQYLSKYIEDGKVPADIFNNLILNHKAIQSTKTKDLRNFLISNGIDYEIVDNAFGFGEKMMVLYNMKKIKNVKQITSKDKIDKYNLLDESVSDILDLPFKKEIESLGGKLYSVGGAVRDKFLGKESKDLDVLITGISFEDLEKLLSKYGRVDAVGKSFGILKFKPQGSSEEIDIAIPRVDKNKQGFLVQKDQTEVFIEYGGLNYEKRNT